jgi:predicted amidohydrolase YtcJ
VDNETILRAYQKAEEIAVRNGVTTVHTMLGDAEYDYLHYEFIMERLSNFKIDFLFYPQMFDVEKALSVNSTRIGGCILADGSFGSRTAAVFERYADDPGNGILYQTDEFWQRFVGNAHEKNLQVGVHCLGDRAVDQIFRAYRKAEKEAKKDMRHQLIHCELIDDSILPEIAENNIACVMQPMFDKLWGGPEQFYAKALGVERAMKTNRFKTMISNGIKIVGSSDWYITPLAPLQGIEALVNHHNPDEKVSIPEAVKIYTENAAWLIHQEDSLGKIKKGYKADFTCLDQDLLNQDKLNTIKSTGVVKNGIYLKTI